ncbi:MAG TPA: hypothetical protein VGH54_29535 [Mycobacterium sp.]|jgi:hypothetical protein|uniref:hypothetical protein n=1 Tax=Mycobacterium sp. TaxID=1785 RepID=UPI002F40200E
MADGTPLAALAKIRGRGYRRDAGVAEAARLSDSAAVDVPRLLAALEAVLKLHEGRECKNCEPGAHRRCRLCDGDWPCSTYNAITRAITGEEISSG